jgi:hypothetical protein
MAAGGTQSVRLLFIHPQQGPSRQSKSSHTKGQFQAIVIEIPDSIVIESVDPNLLPDGWPDGDDEIKTAALGTEWAGSLRTAVLKVPSAAIQSEHNYILNRKRPANAGRSRAPMRTPPRQ